MPIGQQRPHFCVALQLAVFCDSTTSVSVKEDGEDRLAPSVTTPGSRECTVATRSRVDSIKKQRKEVNVAVGTSTKEQSFDCPTGAVISLKFLKCPSRNSVTSQEVLNGSTVAQNASTAAADNGEGRISFSIGDDAASFWWLLSH